MHGRLFPRVYSSLSIVFFYQILSFMSSGRSLGDSHGPIVREGNDRLVHRFPGGEQPISNRLRLKTVSASKDISSHIPILST
jgi:hypothetical protein